jgi:GNAT superfamily N-acetyltransferase
MKDLIIRPATPQDNEPVTTLCRTIDPEDYLQKAWPLWMTRAHSVNLIAQAGNQIIGCIHGEIIAPGEAWAQGMRVHPEMWHSGIGTRLGTALQGMFRGLGIRAVFGTISIFNYPSLAMAAKLGWRTVSRISRRKARGLTGYPVKIPRVNEDEIIKLVHQKPILASRREFSYFRRAYFSMTDEYLIRALKHGRVRVSPDLRSLGLLDFEAEESSENIWAVALTGETTSIRRLLENLLIEAGCSRKDLLVESPEEADLQAMLDQLGFEPADNSRTRYVVTKMTFED